jgi:hypothetical protein
LCSAHRTGLTDPSDANIHCGSGADEIDQETANITVDAISNSESAESYRDCEEPDRDNQHPFAGGGAFFIAIANLCVDIVYAYVDPRVRSRRDSAAQSLRATPRPEPPSSPRSITMPSTISTMPMASTPPVTVVNSFWAIA